MNEDIKHPAERIRKVVEDHSLDLQVEEVDTEKEAGLWISGRDLDRSLEIQIEQAGSNDYKTTVYILQATGEKFPGIYVPGGIPPEDYIRLLIASLHTASTHKQYNADRIALPLCNVVDLDEQDDRITLVHLEITGDPTQDEISAYIFYAHDGEINDEPLDLFIDRSEGSTDARFQGHMADRTEIQNLVPKLIRALGQLNEVYLP